MILKYMLYFLLNSSETQKTLGGKGSEDSSYNPVFSALPETNILNVVKVGENLCILSKGPEPVLWLIV